jgi:hypothetical protein
MLNVEWMMDEEMLEEILLFLVLVLFFLRVIYGRAVGHKTRNGLRLYINAIK